MEKQAIREAMMALEYRRRELIKPYFIDLGLTVGQGQPRILNILLQCGGKSQRELAEASHLDTTTLSRTLDRMVEAGLVSREPHGSSRRAFEVVLTEAGRETARQVHRGFEALDRVICEGFSQAELEILAKALTQIERNLASLELISAKPDSE